MTPESLRDARATLGYLWGLNRPLRASELGRALKMQGRADETVLIWETGKRPVTGPASVAIQAMLDGWRPKSMSDIILRP